MSVAFQAPVQPEAKLWPSVWKLLRLRWVLFASGFRRAKLGRKIGTVALGLVIVSALVAAFVLSWLLLRFLRSPELVKYIGDASVFLDSIPVLILSAEAAVILVTSFGVLLQALYLAGDMEFLLSTPLPIRAIFITKMSQAILPNFGLILLFGLPLLYGLGASAGYSFLYYPMVLIVLALLAMAIAGLASLLVMAVVRIFPARRVAEILGFLVALISIICSQSGNLVRFGDVSQQLATQALNMASRLNSPWSPLSWIGRGLVDVGEGRWLSGGGLVLLTIVLTGGIFALSLATAEKLYFSGWARVQVSVRKKRTARPTIRARSQDGPLARLVAQTVPAAVRGIMFKDFLMLRRDLRSMSQLVTPLVLGALYAFMLISRGGQAPAGREEAPPFVMDALNNMMIYGNVGISLFVGWSLLGRLAAMGFSLEGKQYWLLKSAPVSTARLLTAKFLVAYLPTLALGWVFLVVISLLQQSTLATLIFSLVVVLLTLAGLAGVNLAFGVVGANFEWEDPRKIRQGGAGCLNALASIAFLVISLGLFFGPSLVLGLFKISPAIGQWIGLLLGSVFSLGIGGLALWLVRSRVPRLAES
jgi:ABC-2 type transport system permease protein